MLEILSTIAVLICAHIFADFTFQIGYHIRYKRNVDIKSYLHVLIYTASLALTALIIPIALSWLVLNALAHWAVDSVTAHRLTGFWRQDNKLMFYLLLAADQLLHVSILVLSYFWLV